MIYSEVVLILAGFSVSETLFTLGNMRYLFSVCRASDNLLHREQKAYVELDFKTLPNLGALSGMVSASAEVQVHVPLML